MSLASQNTFVLALLLFTCLIAAAHAELPTLEFEEGAPALISAQPRPIAIGHRTPHIGVIPHDAKRDTAIYEEQSDRLSGLCRHC